MSLTTNSFLVSLEIFKIWTFTMIRNVQVQNSSWPSLMGRSGAMQWHRLLVCDDANIAVVNDSPLLELGSDLFLACVGQSFWVADSRFLSLLRLFPRRAASDGVHKSQGRFCHSATWSGWRFLQVHYGLFSSEPWPDLSSIRRFQHGFPDSAGCLYFMIVTAGIWLIDGDPLLKKG